MRARLPLRSLGLGILAVLVLGAAVPAFAKPPKSLITLNDGKQFDHLKARRQFTELRDRLLKVKAVLKKAKKLPRPYESFPVNLIVHQRDIDIGGDKTTTPALLREIGGLYMELGEPERAADAYQLGLDGLPDTSLQASLLNGLGSATLDLDEAKAANDKLALATFTRSAQLEQDFTGLKIIALYGGCYAGWRVWHYGGKADDKAWAAAESSCNLALRWSPAKPLEADIRVTLAFLYADHKDEDHEREQLDKALEADPKNVPGRVLSAEAYLGAGAVKKAKADHKVLAKLDRKRAAAVLKLIQKKSHK